VIMILQSLCGYYERLANDPDSGVANPGYALTPVSSCIVLDEEGRVRAVDDLREIVNKKLAPRKTMTPIQPKRAGSKPAPAFMCENAQFIFGIHEKRDGANYRFNASREIHQTILANVADVGATAILRFFEKRVPGSYDYAGIDTSCLASGNIVFRLLGENNLIHERPAIKQAWEKYQDTQEAEAIRNQCLITGEVSPIARLHGNFSGFGADKPTLVGFNQKSFESFGKNQGENAPVSIKAAFRYTTALNMLLNDRQHCINLHGCKVVFWAEQQATLEEGIISALWGGNVESYDTELDEVGSRKIKDALNSLYSGKQPSELGLKKLTAFYLLGVSANKTRLVVRFFHRSSFGELVDKFMLHYNDIDIMDNRPDWRLPSPYLILSETAVQRKSDNVPAPLFDGLMCSVLNGSPYPHSLYWAIINRIRAEAGSDATRAINRVRIGIVKGCLNRWARQNNTKGLMQVSLNEEEKNISYLLGRLFAVLEKAQYEALGNLNSTIVDKYLNSAMATPQNVFPMLLSLAEKHISKYQKEKSIKVSYTKKLIGKILESIPSEGFPQTMNAEDQGRFMVGYYHQRQHFFTKTAGKTDGANDEQEIIENGGTEND